MKRSFSIVCFCLFFGYNLFGQDSLNENIVDQNLKEFEDFIAQFAKMGSDDDLNICKSGCIYNILFTTYSFFADPKTHFSRAIKLDAIRKDSSSVEIISLHSISDNHVRDFRGDTNHRIKTRLFKQMWGEHMKDSMRNLESSPSIWASRITANEVIFSSKTQEDLGIQRMTNSTYPYETDNQGISGIISYDKGKYLIIDMIVSFSYIGGQTDYGLCLTYFLEREE